jgi:hypothetical protein
MLFIFHDKRPSLFGNIVLRKHLKHFIWGDKIVVEFSGDKAFITEVIDKGLSAYKTQTWISSFTACE